VPFTMSYRPAYTGLGILAGFLAAILGLSFYARKRIGAKLWRRMHRWTIGVYALGVVHTLGAGTDASTTWMRILLGSTGTPILALLVLRLRPVRHGATGAQAPTARVKSPTVGDRRGRPERVL
jgi:sulfoxide reductase heme-binding subunit YedZ